MKIDFSYHERLALINEHSKILENIILKHIPPEKQSAVLDLFHLLMEQAEGHGKLSGLDLLDKKIKETL